MSSTKKLFDETPSKLAENIVLFTRLLRATGMHLGTASAIDATKAATVIDLANKRFFFMPCMRLLLKGQKTIHCLNKHLFCSGKIQNSKNGSATY